MKEQYPARLELFADNAQRIKKLFHGKMQWLIG